MSAPPEAMATGVIDNQFNTATGPSTLYGISVFGEQHTGTAPEPTSLALHGAGLAGFGLARRRRKPA